jgi:hypothetical protein
VWRCWALGSRRCNQPATAQSSPAFMGDGFGPISANCHLWIAITQRSMRGQRGVPSSSCARVWLGEGNDQSKHAGDRAIGPILASGLVAPRVIALGGVANADVSMLIADGQQESALIGGCHAVGQSIADHEDLAWGEVVNRARNVEAEAALEALHADGGVRMVLVHAAICPHGNEHHPQRAVLGKSPRRVIGRSVRIAAAQ